MKTITLLLISLLTITYSYADDIQFRCRHTTSVFLLQKKREHAVRACRARHSRPANGVLVTCERAHPHFRARDSLFYLGMVCRN